MKKGKAKVRVSDEIKMDKIKNHEYLKKDPYQFDPFENWIWRKYDSNHVVNIDEFIENNRDCKFFIGTDSQNYPKSKKCIFTSVLIAYKMRRGGAVIRYTDKRPLIPKEALSAKLTVETQRSIEICKFVENKLFELSEVDNKDYTENLVGISIDCNCDELKGKSGRYKDMLVGMVIAYGWKAFIKPDAWASSNVADSKC